MRDLPFARLGPELVRAARWRAARYGAEGSLVDLRSGRLVAARTMVAELLSRLRADLEHLGNWDEAVALTDALLSRGTSSARQRAVFARTGQLRDVVRAVVSEGTAH